jgi:hypothetical protein
MSGGTALDKPLAHELMADEIYFDRADQSQYQQALGRGRGKLAFPHRDSPQLSV